MLYEVITPFVADFVGQADFIPGTVSHGIVQTELGEFPNTLECEDGASLVVMIRPDDIHLVPTKGAPAHVLSRQFRGSENLYAVSLPSGRVVHSSQSSTSVYQEGTPVELRVLASHTVRITSYNVCYTKLLRPIPSRHRSIPPMFA